jgi:alkylation response protein AidB-like acyl-CoA dehydrogenase
MNLRLTDEHTDFAKSVREALEREFPPERMRDQQGPELWRSHLARVGQLGLVGALVAPEDGGLGLLLTDIVAAVEAVGYAAPCSACIEAVTLGAVVGSMVDGTEDLLHGRMLVSGSLWPDGIVAYAEEADALVCSADGELRLLDDGEWISTALPWLDDATPIATVVWDPERYRVVVASCAHLRAVASVVTAAFQLGVACRLVDMARAHSLQRQQFGVPIGSFQAVKHALATAVLSCEVARPTVWRAAWSVAQRDASAGRDASMARVYAGDAAATAAQTGLQVHGAIGYAREHPLGIWLKAAWSLDARWGTTQQHRDLLAEAVLAPDPLQGPHA